VVRLAWVSAFASACLGFFDTLPGIVSGEWRAVYGDQPPATRLLTLSLDEAESGSVSGTAWVLAGTDTIPATVTGVHEAPSVRLDINRPDGSDLGGLDGFAYHRDRITIDFGSWGVTALVRLADPPRAAATSP
jgi:hypothetical protein